jgi:hypothetical protein
MNPTERFSDRVEDYRRYRPGYPPGVIELIRETSRLEPDAEATTLPAASMPEADGKDCDGLGLLRFPFGVIFQEWEIESKRAKLEI